MGLNHLVAQHALVQVSGGSLESPFILSGPLLCTHDDLDPVAPAKVGL